MHSFLEELKRFARARGKKYRLKVYRLVLLFSIALVFIFAAAIALSKIFLALAGSAAVSFIAYWIFSRIRNFEFAAVIEYIKNLLQRLRGSIRDKEDELKDLDKDPSQFSFLELLQ